MLEYLFLTFIEPLEAGMKLALESGHAWTDSWGLGLIFMSLCVNIVLLPLYHLAETWQEAERRVQQGMEKKLNEIRAVFKGQERYAMMRTLYRQHGYHPIYAVRTSFGFLIQVPFFFAAYHFLSNYESLRNVSFGPLENLGAPDGLLVLGGLAINVLPFLMTAINLLSATVYTHRLSKKEKIQLYGIAGLFLVLLYTANAGLVFYWTCNNIFSLLKNIVYERFKLLDNMFRQPAQQEKKIPSHSLAPATGSTPASLWQARIAWLLTAAVVAVTPFIPHLAGVQTDGFSPQEQIFSSIILILLCFCCGLATFFWGRQEKWRKSRLVAVLVLLCLQVGWLAMHREFITSKETLPIVVPAIAILFLSLYPFWSKNLAGTKINSSSLALSSLGILLSFSFLYVPTRLFLSDPSFFQNDFSRIAAAATWLIASVLIIYYIIKRFLNHTLKIISSFTLALFAIMGLSYGFLFTADHGLMSIGIFQDGYSIYYSYFYKDFCIFISSALLLIAFFYKKKTQFLIITYNIITIAICIFCTYSLFTISAAEEKNSAVKAAYSALPTEYLKYSKSGTNVIVIVLDMFAGGHMERILKDYPELRTELDGFTWYPDTIAVGWGTPFSFPGLITGEKMDPVNIANMHPGLLLKEKINIEYANYFNELAKKNFDISVQEQEWLSTQLLEKYLQTHITTSRVFAKKSVREWRKRRGITLRQHKDFSLFFPFLVGIFQSAPQSLHKLIYQDGAWLGTMGDNNTGYSEGSYAFLDSLPDNSQIVDDNRNKYTFFHNTLTHSPWRMDIHTELPTAEDPYPATKGEMVKVDGVYPEHYYSEVCAIKAIARYVSWLKKNTIYDNTQIILVSDHEITDNILLDEIFSGAVPGRPQALLLVKNQNSRGPVQISHDLMSTSDVPAIIEEDFLHKGQQMTGKWKDPNRVRWHMVAAYENFTSKTTFTAVELYKITGTMFKKENWVRVQ